jgi:tight adherence protein C
MEYFLLILLAVLIVLYVISKDKYGDQLRLVDEKRYPLKKIMPIAFYLLEYTKYKYATQYDKKLLSKIIEISGTKCSRDYLNIHWANKISYFISGIVIMAFIGVGAGIDVTFGVFSVVVLGAVVYLADNELDRLIKKRRLAIRMDFPDFLNKLILLVNAGMTINRAWNKIVADNEKKGPLYEELENMLLNISSGQSEFQAFEDFAKRCRTPEITRFVSVIIQNLKKGNSDMISILRLQSNDCWELRKNVAKRIGEEASTKMLLPMMIMFLAILIIVAVPAILAMQGI